MHKAHFLSRRALILLMLILCFNDVVMAGDSATFAVSCSIPVVPGLNAPIDAKTEVITEESTPKTMLTENSGPSLKTIYYR
jgi:hypothetical protein